MKKHTLLLILSLSLSFLYAKEITVSVGAGQHWKEKREPQFSVLFEDSDGNFIRTLYATERASHKSWMMSPKEGRPESLPVWYHSSKHESSRQKNMMLKRLSLMQLPAQLQKEEGKADTLQKKRSLLNENRKDIVEGREENHRKQGKLCGYEIQKRDQNAGSEEEGAFKGQNALDSRIEKRNNEQQDRDRKQNVIEENCNNA